MSMRWDIRIGACAAIIAALGLSSSIVTGNEKLLLADVFGTADLNQQKLFLALTCVIGGLTAFKWWWAKRSTRQ